MTSMPIPPELKLSIADHLDPVSSFNFALTCKEHWELCQPVLKAHARGFAEAPVLDSNNVQTDFWGTLKDVLRDSRKGWYFTEMSLTSGFMDHHCRAPGEVAEDIPNAAMKLMDLYPPGKIQYLSRYWKLRSETNTFPHLQRPNEVEDCIVSEIRKQIANGSPDGAIALLVHYLPNLKTLRMTLSFHGTVFDTLLHRIAIEYGNTAKAPHLPLRRLRTAAVCHYDTENYTRASWTLPFLRIPSLRTFAALMMGGNIVNEEESTEALLGPPPQSNIEELLFSSCSFDARAVEYFLACTPSLKRFTYSSGGPCVGDKLYDPKIIIHALEKYTRDSLEYAVLQHHDLFQEERLSRDRPILSSSAGVRAQTRPKRPTTVDLTTFTKLRGLHANWAMLWPEIYHDNPIESLYMFSPNLEYSRAPLDVRKLLPSSLEMLHLHGGCEEWEWTNLVEPFSSPSDQTPRLTTERMRIDCHLHGTRGSRQQVVVEPGAVILPCRRGNFGGAENKWFERAVPPFHLFEGHGW